MKTGIAKSQERIVFADLPRNYHDLCAKVYLPRPIHSLKEYAAAERITDAMAGFEEGMTRDQSDYFDVITDFMSDYDETHRAFTPSVSGLDILKSLVEENEISGAELSRILGASERSLGTKILNGSRRITADHARKLGERFAMEPGAFL